MSAAPHTPAARLSGGHPSRSAALGLEKPQDFKGTIKKVLAYLLPFRIHLIAVSVFALVSTVFNIVGPKVLSLATTEIFEGSTARLAGLGSIDFTVVAQILLSTLILYAVSAAGGFIQSIIMAGVSQKLSYRLRRDIEAKIDRMPFAYFERSSTGDVLSRITNDVDTLGQTLSQGLTTLITSAITLVGVLAMMLSISPVLSAVSLVMIPLALVLVRFLIGKSQKHFKAQQELLGAINGQVEETFSGHVVVRAFGKEQASVARFEDSNTRLFNAAWKSQFISSLMMPAMNFISNFGYVLVALLGGYLALQRAITVGDIQAFVQYIREFARPVQQLSQVANILQSMAAAAERVFAFLDEEEIEDTPARGELHKPRGEVQFNHVRFGYEADKPVIKDFNAKVAPGQTVALVGHTGAGKTTMVKLLMRFYDVDAGAILLDGCDIRQYDRSDLRNQFAMVLQETWLFNGSIRENIRYGNLEATDKEVEAAAKAAHAHWFISTLPGGYDMEINEDATNISAGQRQLITIARAILANKPMLILDEATSSVDTRTEQLIQQAMDNLMKGRTSFVIAHRLSTIRNADLILCMVDGDIVEQGTHETLLELGGFYYDLYNAQFNQ